MGLAFVNMLPKDNLTYHCLAYVFFNFIGMSIRYRNGERYALMKAVRSDPVGN